MKTHRGYFITNYKHIVKQQLFHNSIYGGKLELNLLKRVYICVLRSKFYTVCTFYLNLCIDTIYQ